MGSMLTLAVDAVELSCKCSVMCRLQLFVKVMKYLIDNQMCSYGIVWLVKRETRMIKLIDNALQVIILTLLILLAIWCFVQAFVGQL